MNVGYTRERAHDLVARLQRTTGELEAAAVVVECSRRITSESSTAAERARLRAALDEYDRRCTRR